MSRTTTGRPEFRLNFGYPFITVERPGAAPLLIALDSGDPASALRGLAAEVRRIGARVTAVLPEAEVWRGSAAGADRAKRLAAVALGAAPERLSVVLGSVAADGARGAAGVRRETLAEARAFLARSGLRPAAITAPGASRITRRRCLRGRRQPQASPQRSPSPSGSRLGDLGRPRRSPLRL